MPYILAALLASLGLTTIRFWRFTPPVPRTSPAYLSLLAAVTLIAKFAFLRDGSPTSQRLRGWLAAVAVTISLYLLFGSIAYYAKVIQDTNFASLTYLFVPAVMLIILWVNTAYDAWDFAERRNQLLPRPPDTDAARSEETKSA